MQKTLIATRHPIKLQKIMLCRTATWNDLQFLRSIIVLKYQRPGETFRTCGSILQGITAKGQEAGRTTNQQSIDHVRLGVHKIASKNIQRGRRCGNSAESQKLKNARDYLGSAKKQHIGTIVERDLEDGKYQMRMHEQGYTQSDMEVFDTIANDNRNYVASHP